MIIQNWITQCAESRVRHIVLVFGVGLIGKSVQCAIQKCYLPLSEEFQFSWICKISQLKQIADIKNRVLELGHRGSTPVQVDIIWSAGKGGFGANSQVFREESRAFEMALTIAKSILVDLARCKIRFHLLSTAGGLYEGQLVVDSKSVVSTHRAYGLAKLELEASLATLPDEIEKLIYRPSSVYGYGGRGARIGLVVAAVQSTINNSSVRIYAKPDTLRDYVFVEDIGRFIASNIKKEIFDQNIFILASGKPTATVELIGLIEQVTGKRLSVQYELTGDNTTSNSYLPTCLPNGWIATSLETGVYLTIMKIRNDFIQ